ncbi:MAG TPA: DUF1080 domain-containing protein [Bacteroidales bacterium]|nr:DUF1080 domain-containing protein [Bacteroidales bacterium]
MKKFFLYAACLFLLSAMVTSCGKKAETPAKTDSVSANVDTNWRQLFNGKDLTGWKHVGDGEHYVEDGLIKSKGGMGLLFWEGQKFGNCKLKVVFRMRDENSNSGVFIRIPIKPYEAWMPVYYGYEVQIDNKPELSQEDYYHYTGGLYSLTWPKSRPGKPGPEWNTYEITLDGPRTIVVVNDSLVTDFTEGDSVPERKFDFEPFHGPRPDSGYFGIQNHGEKDVVFFKEIAWKPLMKNPKK